MKKNICMILILSLLGGILFAKTPKVFKDWVPTTQVKYEDVLEYGIEKCFVAEPLSLSVMLRMKDNSYKKGCPVKLKDLRYLKVLHYDSEGAIMLGEMVCNKKISEDLLEVFRELFDLHYPIQRMVLIDDYGADNEESMRNGNTSCFCYRKAEGSKKLSTHAYGLAVDLNKAAPLDFTERGVMDEEGVETIHERDRRVFNSITTDDLSYQVFTKYGFAWGGDFPEKDTQHFEKVK